MDELTGKNIIESLQKKWNQQNLIAYVIVSAAVSIFASAIIIRLFHTHWLIGLAILVIAILAAIFLFSKKIGQTDVVRFLNETFPELEESTSLLLKNHTELNGLQKFQVNKIGSKIGEAVSTPPVLKKKIKKALVLLLIAVVVALLLFLMKTSIPGSSMIDTSANSAVTGKPETKPAQVENAEIRIIPPAYTRKDSRKQDRFNIVAEQGAEVNWAITTTASVKQIELVFNDRSIVHLQSNGNNHTKWSGTKQITSAGFYQVKINNTLSELYQVEMIKDQPPVIVVQSPKPNTVIEYGQPKQVLINVLISDDYGIESAFINTTTATGSGEAVKFKEQQVAFSDFKTGNQKNQLQKQLDLSALGMQPGDELYFYVNARDSYKQEKRSDVYIVRMEDTAQLMSMDGLVSGVDLKPEFFRSERQIIIETEQLLKDKDTISIESFNKKSSDLGVDQKLLRLRYGKFLGEENETEIGEDHGNSEGSSNGAADFGNADKILDQYSHKHDNAEDASFFDAKTKKQLLATLSEMWSAELRLRTLKPKDALPFEYKALRLLKDLQQQTRAYVGKASTKTTPLKPEIRLTGDLSKVVEPVLEQDVQQKQDPTVILRKALGILEQVRNKEVLQSASLEALQQASMQLSVRAAQEPSVYLESLAALRRILKNESKPRDINLAGSALQRMIRSTASNPQRSKTAPDMKLSQRYFMNLNRKND